VPARQLAREVGSGCEESGYLFLDQSLLLHRGGKNDLSELVSPRLPMRCCVSVVAVFLLRRVGQLVHHVVNVGHVVQELIERFDVMLQYVEFRRLISRAAMVARLELSSGALSQCDFAHLRKGVALSIV
jgi:hypothetical protein